ncbi:MAG: chromosomal replication initiator DnaA [Rhodobacteraceae bacterium]|nr:chromosomal replication initiator DnaA [Paracoccaceae bacterium]
MSASEQLVLDLPVRQALGRDDFFVAPCNAVAVAQLEGWARWPEGRLALVGPSGSGKTHLAHVWAGLSGAQIIDAAKLSIDDAAAALVVENVDQIDGNETSLFHVYNEMNAQGGALLITGQTAPSRWALSLPDLSSRLQSVPVVALEPPDDTLLSMLLAKLFDDRQLPVSPKLIAYLLKRVGRSYQEVNTLVKSLDKAALAAGKPLSVRFVSSFLNASNEQNHA